ncbi:SRPBCC domain-containing protein [Streptomyces sp. HU2014]|uniref:SRPBCC domain-containing protein n=1 Tax=Streptomyces sp. HU2014 TaxID=2939414 RepID=UPI002010257F|nr:SRPBCC domain-containing protein [Streptomyces sp. HU2014]UQI46732.1 SRPBCC domain-containing protein [Streptomyces sp. HU2014]
MTFRPRVLTAEPGRELRWLGRLPVPGLFEGEHRFLLTPVAGGTRLVQSEVFRGLLVPLLERRIRDTRTDFRSLNAALKARAERRPPV